jgi:RecG-like helicase
MLLTLSTVSFAGPFSILFAVRVVTPKVDLGAVDEALTNQTVEVQGTIKSINTPREGSRAPYKLSVADETGSLNLVVWQPLWDELNSQRQLAVGDKIRLTAQVSRYRDELQLKIANTNELEVVSKTEPSLPENVNANAPPAVVSTTAPPTTVTAPAKTSTTPLSAINDALKGTNITVQGNITNISEPSSERAPYRVTLSQDNATMLLVYWKDMQEAVTLKMRIGNTIRANVTVSDYRDTIQLRLRDPQSVQVLSAGQGGATNALATAKAASGSPSGTVSIVSITEKMTNQTVTVAGQIKTSEKTSKGQRVWVQDNSGEILVWDLGSKIPENALKPGRSITVTGPVQKYRDHLEIQPASVNDVKFAD